MENELRNVKLQNIISYIILIILEVIFMLLTILILNGGIVSTFIVGTIILTLWFIIKCKVAHLDYEDLYDHKLERMKVKITREVKNETKKEITYKKKNLKEEYDDEEIILYLRNKQEKYAILKENNNPAPIGIIVSFLGMFSAITSSILKSGTDVTDLKQWLIVISIAFILICSNLMMCINKNTEYSMKINLLKIEQENIEKKSETSEKKDDKVEKDIEYLKEKISEYKYKTELLEDICKVKVNSNNR